LLHFAPFCNVSCLRCANRKCKSQKAFCSTFTLGTVLQYQQYYPQICPIKGINLKLFLEHCRSSPLFLSPDHNSCDSYLIVHPNQATKLSKSLSGHCHSSHFACLPCCQCKYWTRHFSPVAFIKESILCNIMCLSVTKGRIDFVEAVSFIPIHQIYSFNYLWISSHFKLHLNCILNCIGFKPFFSPSYRLVESHSVHHSDCTSVQTLPVGTVLVTGSHCQWQDQAVRLVGPGPVGLRA
jgi:hypothetical protein